MKYEDSSIEIKLDQEMNKNWEIVFKSVPLNIFLHFDFFSYRKNFGLKIVPFRIKLDF